MELNLEELLKGQKTRIRNNEFFSTEAYVMPFIERMKKYTDDFVCQAIGPTQLSLDQQGNEHTLYNKVLVEAVLPGGDEINSEVIGFTYSLDSRKPLVRFFKCFKRADTGALFLNNEKFIVTKDLEPEIPVIYSPIDKLMEMELSWDWIQDLQQHEWTASNDTVNFKLGQWIRFAIAFSIDEIYGKIKIAPNDVISGYKSLFEDSESIFFSSLGKNVNFYNTLTAFNSILYESRKDPVNLIRKTILMKNILSIN